MSWPFPSGYNRYVYIAATTCALGGLLFGYDTGIISGALLFIKKDLGLSAFLQSAVVSAILVGAIVGAGTSGPLADRFGRRKMTIVAAVVFIIGALGSAFAPNVTLLIIARVILGLSVGSSTIFVPAYISELAPTELRGTLTSLFQLAITIGIVVAYLVNYALSGAGAWRWMLGLGVVPAVVLLVGMLPLPESPRWLVGQDRKDEARGVLGRVREDEARINEEMEEMEEAERREEAGWRELLQPWVRPMLVVGIGLAMGQQLVGINTIIYYAPTILSSTGLAASSSILATLVVGIVNVLFTIVSLVIVDRVGRRPLLLTGLVGIIIALGVLGVGYLPGLSGATTWITFAGLILYIASFAVSYGVVLWVVLPEIFPLRIRGSGMSVCTILHWSSNLAVSLSFLPLIQAIGETATFWIYGAIAIAAFTFVYLLLPETKGRSLERIEVDLRGKASVQT
ncbi:MAG: sugar porter family MFS transporter [Actinobacteria bacterium]|nr:sugar porter family MFS transporter [Actinomycetota bacterium]